MSPPPTSPLPTALTRQPPLCRLSAVFRLLRSSHRMESWLALETIYRLAGHMRWDSAGLLAQRISSNLETSGAEVGQDAPATAEARSNVALALGAFPANEHSAAMLGRYASDEAEVVRCAAAKAAELLALRGEEAGSQPVRAATNECELTRSTGWEAVRRIHVTDDGVITRLGDAEANGAEANRAEANGVEANGVESDGAEANGVEAADLLPLVRRSPSSEGGARLLSSFLGRSTHVGAEAAMRRAVVTASALALLLAAAARARRCCRLSGPRCCRFASPPRLVTPSSAERRSCS